MLVIKVCTTIGSELAQAIHEAIDMAARAPFPIAIELKFNKVKLLIFHDSECDEIIAQYNKKFKG